MNIDGKDELIFIPHYVGSLRYFERLRPFLESKYKVSYLLMPFSEDKFFEEMDNFCNENGLNKYIVGKEINNKFLNRIPFYSILKKAFCFKKGIENFLKNKNIKKIISVNDCGFPLAYFFIQAKKKGIDTMVLQWALVSPGQKAGPDNKSKVPLRKIIYKYGKPFYVFIKTKLLELVVGKELNRSKCIIGGGTADRFGVINERTREYLVSLGIPKEKMSVVGFMDFYLAENIKKQLNEKKDNRDIVANKLGVNLNKKNIVIFSSPYTGDVVNIMDNVGQVNFYREIVRIIYDICPKEEYQVLLKIHPRENKETYNPLVGEDVLVFDKNANNFELVYLAGLYIADSTTTNFIPICMDKNAIFINFTKMELIEMTKKDFSIKKFVTEKDEFKKLLLDFKEGKLERQYELDNNIITENSLEKIINWID